MAADRIDHLTIAHTSSTIDLYPHLPEAFGPVGGSGNPIDLLVADENTAPLIPEECSVPRIVVPAGEAAKDMAVLLHLLEAMVEHRIPRDGVVVGFGGGAVTDLTAFAASIYLRGVAFVLIPTTLLAMVDAAVGGKTGVDFRGYKNMIGSFAPAQEVRIAPELLATLPEREFLSGLAEVIKAGLLGDSRLVEILEAERDAVLSREPEVLRTIITRAIAVKVAVVREDFTESGRRAHLNLGHTFGHALEAVLGLGAVTHGEAVAWGILRATDAAERVGIADHRWAERTRQLLAGYGYPTELLPRGADPKAVIDAIQYDKKRRRDGVRFVLQSGPQETVLRVLDDATVRAVFGA